ncbi:MAG: VOC family protein [Spirochaetia bacterium]|jgi:catechol 2,3-dioxygenase-like lactoylglutathione lyase family enzyme|nr:VOC family protein [Spirochaetia bacterium]
MESYDLLEQSIGQIAFVTPDLEKSIKAYTTTFKTNWTIYTYGPEILSTMRYHGKDSPFSIRIGLSYFGKTRIEFVQPLGGKTIHRDFLDKKGYGIQHLGIYVENMEKEIKKAEKAGIAIIMEGAGFGLDGDGRFVYLDTLSEFGVTYELIERPKQRRPPEATIFTEG